MATTLDPHRSRPPRGRYRKLSRRKTSLLVAGTVAMMVLAGVATGVTSAGAAKTVPTCPGIPGCRKSLDQRAGWEGWVTNSSTRGSAGPCSGRVMKPFLDANFQADSWTELYCPQISYLTVRSRLRANYQFADITVAQRGCVNKGQACVIKVPLGFSYYQLVCPKTQKNYKNRIYYTDLIFYKGTDSAHAVSVRSRDATLSPNCAY